MASNYDRLTEDPCPKCGGVLVVDLFYPQTRIDPESSRGHCTTKGCDYEWDY